LAKAGFTAVSFNFSGSGVGPDGQSFSEPERFGHATFSNDLADIQAVCDALLGGTLVEGLAVPTRLGLFGHSRGGGMALIHTGGSSRVEALVTWAAIGRTHRWPEATTAKWRRDGKIDIVNARTGDVLPLYTDLLDDIDAHRSERLNLPAAAGRVTVPWLILHGEADETVPPAEAEALRDAAGSPEVVMRVVSGGSHTMGSQHPWAGLTPALKVAMEETVVWFSQYLI
jgi:dienelactone hydrolase